MPKRRILALIALVAGLAHAEHEGMATHFLGVGYPYGACGVPDSIAAWEAGMDTLTGQGNPFDYVALNVFDLPGDYASHPHPLKGADTAHLGMYDNGRNCGRWLRLRLGEACDGTNDGKAGAPFCRDGAWKADAYTGSGLYAIVFDQCSDGNAWCRDSRAHLDLHTPILGRLRQDDSTLMPPLAQPALDGNGKPQADANNPWAVYYQVTGFNNPKVRWDFTSAPAYRGEPRFWFSQGSKLWYMRLIVTHLPNGIHGMEQLVDGTWKPAAMDGDAGQQWLLPDPSKPTVTLRLTGADDQPVLGGRTWTLTYPASCHGDCLGAATAAQDVQGSGGTAGLAAAHLSRGALRREGGAVLLDAPGGDGRLELFTMDGRSLGGAPVQDGKARIETRTGAVLARWQLGPLRGQQILPAF